MFGRYNVTAHGDENVKEKYRLTEYPAIKFFKREFPYSYDGGNNADTIVSWIKRRIRGRSLPTEELDIPEKLGDNIKKRNKGGVFVFYGNITSNAYRNFARIGKKYTDYDVLFGHTENDRTLRAFNVTPTYDEKNGFLVLFNKIPPHVYIFEEEVEYKFVKRFLNFNQKKDYEVLDWTVSNRVDRTPTTILVLFHKANDTLSLQNQFKILAPKIKLSTTVILCDVDD